MTATIILVQQAVAIKPSFGLPCNNCGYCCLEEVCEVGKMVTGSSVAPCSLLIQRDDDKHYCGVGENDMYKDALGIGFGCCAKTQAEVISELKGDS